MIIVACSDRSQDCGPVRLQLYYFAIHMAHNKFYYFLSFFVPYLLNFLLVSQLYHIAADTVAVRS